MCSRKVGGGDVGEVERRILAHQHHVEVREVDRFERPERRVAASLPPDLEGLGVRGEAPLAEAQIGRKIVVEGVPAALRLEGERERAVGVDVDAVHVVHLDGDGEGHDLAANSRGSEACAILPASTGRPGTARRLLDEERGGSPS